MNTFRVHLLVDGEESWWIIDALEAEAATRQAMISARLMQPQAVISWDYTQLTDHPAQWYWDRLPRDKNGHLAGTRLPG